MRKFAIAAKEMIRALAARTLGFRIQPKLDIHTGCNEGAAASARAFPKAAIQQTVAALADAAVSSKGSEAQEAPFANSAV